jgi:hypothetical protein
MSDERLSKRSTLDDRSPSTLAFYPLPVVSSLPPVTSAPLAAPCAEAPVQIEYRDNTGSTIRDGIAVIFVENPNVTAPWPAESGISNGLHHYPSCSAMARQLNKLPPDFLAMLGVTCAKGVIGERVKGAANLGGGNAKHGGHLFCKTSYVMFSPPLQPAPGWRSHDTLESKHYVPMYMDFVEFLDAHKIKWSATRTEGNDLQVTPGVFLSSGVDFDFPFCLPDDADHMPKKVKAFLKRKFFTDDDSKYHLQFFPFKYHVNLVKTERWC